MELHFPSARTIADLTWGKGAFWRGETIWRVIGADIAPRMGCQIRSDSRAVPLKDEAVDVTVFDPPFMHAVSKNTQVRLQADYTRLPNQRAVRQLYLDSFKELWRVAAQGSIIKCSDIVEAGKLNVNHAGIITAFGAPEDIAILDSGAVRPMRSGARVLHFRQAHSFFLIYKWARKEQQP